MADKLLDEYVRVTRAIENIQDKIARYKKSIIYHIDNSKTEQERNDHIKEFRGIIDTIKNDASITKKYRMLKDRQTQLREMLLSPDRLTVPNIDTHSSESKRVNHIDYRNNNITESITDNLIGSLRRKYESESINNDTVSISSFGSVDSVDSKRSAQNNQISMILQEVQKNLLKHEISRMQNNNESLFRKS